ncbi:hypothetical protein J7F03_17080 [Streptomyces sp. ISL-43]|uniref:PfkB family carbohydrate kinase n=1 Tax=Streptomyces sp. ISL-43 TaxID=2819183 RepID=UPI001BE79B16|nr:PfkB family carbohydrate kinase [Streptomyces sp. ISL-43]MBT2448774.1 hypothetical protein [Streptomyces sp. ISL-43]
MTGPGPGPVPAAAAASEGYDVLVLGEVLVEIHAGSALRDAADGTPARISYSGDALNAAAAAVAAGARTALLAVVGEDELSAPLLARAAELGVDVSHVRRSPRPNGAYLLCADTEGDRAFVYWRTGSAGSTLSVEHVESWRELLTGCKALITSGITGALSPSSRDAVLAAAQTVHESGGHLSYDPNFRSRLTSRGEARELLARVAPLTGLLKTSCPADALAMVDTDDPAEAAARYRALGARSVVVTAGADRLLLSDGTADGAADGTADGAADGTADGTADGAADGTAGGVDGRTGATYLPVPVNPDPVDATGAGDCFTGTATARLALGDTLADAVAYGMAAASLSVSGRGGTGRVPAFTETAALAAAHRRPASRPTATAPGPSPRPAL